MISTLVLTISIEGIVVTGYSVGRKKPVYPILFTSLCANLITQSFLWTVLTLFFRHYSTALLTAEIVIWLAESFLLSILPANRLQFTEAIFLSLVMNLISFASGLFLPV